MKCILRPVLLVLMISLNGCLLFGWHENGDPTPRLADRDYWNKPNIDEAQRKKDWIACGGNGAGYVKISPVNHTGGLTVEDGIQGKKRI